MRVSALMGTAALAAVSILLTACGSTPVATSDAPTSSELPAPQMPGPRSQLFDVTLPSGSVLDRTDSSPEGGLTEFWTVPGQQSAVSTTLEQQLPVGRDFADYPWCRGRLIDIDGDPVGPGVAIAGRIWTWVKPSGDTVRIGTLDQADGWSTLVIVKKEEGYPGFSVDSMSSEEKCGGPAGG